MNFDTERRINTVYKALNKPPTFFGIHRLYAYGVGLFGIVLYVLLSSPLLAVFLAAVVMMAIRHATSDDLDAITIYLAASSMPATYDGGRFSRTEVNKL
jgi:type IV secretory pathway VirB3-like protein